MCQQEALPARYKSLTGSRYFPAMPLLHFIRRSDFFIKSGSISIMLLLDHLPWCRRVDREHCNERKRHTGSVATRKMVPIVWIKNDGRLEFEFLVILFCVTSRGSKSQIYIENGRHCLWCCIGNDKRPPIAMTFIETFFQYYMKEDWEKKVARNNNFYWRLVIFAHCQHCFLNNCASVVFSWHCTWPTVALETSLPVQLSFSEGQRIDL